MYILIVKGKIKGSGTREQMLLRSKMLTTKDWYLANLNEEFLCKADKAEIKNSFTAEDDALLEELGLI